MCVLAIGSQRFVGHWRRGLTDDVRGNRLVPSALGFVYMPLRMSRFDPWGVIRKMFFYKLPVFFLKKVIRRIYTFSNGSSISFSEARMRMSEHILCAWFCITNVNK